LGIDLPSPPDANIYDYGYCESPDNYTVCHGAKIWLIPASALDGGNLPVTVWPPTDKWLFETNLIWYDDLNVGSTGPVGLTVTVPDIVAISVTPSALNFGTLVPGSTSDILDIIVTNVGTTTVDVDADVSGDDLFVNNLELKDCVPTWSTRPWPLVANDLVMGANQSIRTKLTVPSDYTPQGVETATLIFEARA